MMMTIAVHGFERDICHVVSTLYLYTSLLVLCCLILPQGMSITLANGMTFLEQQPNCRRTARTSSSPTAYSLKSHHQFRTIDDNIISDLSNQTSFKRL